MNRPAHNPRALLDSPPSLAKSGTALCVHVKSLGGVARSPRSLGCPGKCVAEADLASRPAPSDHHQLHRAYPADHTLIRVDQLAVCDRTTTFLTKRVKRRQNCKMQETLNSSTMHWSDLGTQKVTEAL